METVSLEKEIICKGVEVEKPVSEQKIWLAVLLQAVEDWKSDNAKLQRDAAQFLFREEEDFDIVCTGAGIEPTSFRSRLTRTLHAPSRIAA